MNAPTNPPPPPPTTLPTANMSRPLRGPNIMAIAPVGAGKTHAIRSLVDQGLEVFAMVTEPGIDVICGDIPSTKLHWNYLPPTPMSFDMLFKQTQDINSMTFEQLAQQKVNRNEFRQMLDFVNLLKNFKCQRTGDAYGDVAKWDSSRAFVIDSLSGLTMMAANAYVGTRVALGPSDYQVVQKLIENTINSLCMNLNCWFFMTAHVEKETNEITGAVEVMASTLGRKLAPKLGRFFDEVILMKRDGDKFSWSNNERGIDLKKRLLPLNSTLEPNFALLNAAWRAKAHQTT